jgi:hypothetical protein
MRRNREAPRDGAAVDGSWLETSFRLSYKPSIKSVQIHRYLMIAIADLRRPLNSIQRKSRIDKTRSRPPDSRCKAVMRRARPACAEDTYSLPIVCRRYFAERCCCQAPRAFFGNPFYCALSPGQTGQCRRSANNLLASRLSPAAHLQ